MFIEPTEVAGAIVIIMIAYQQYILIRLDRDIDELTDKHNDFVETVSKVFAAIVEASEEMEEDTL